MPSPTLVGSMLWVSDLPNLPHPDYPESFVVRLQSDHRRYRNVGGRWLKESLEPGEFFVLEPAEEVIAEPFHARETNVTCCGKRSFPDASGRELCGNLMYTIQFNGAYYCVCGIKTCSQFGIYFECPRVELRRVDEETKRELQKTAYLPDVLRKSPDVKTEDTFAK